MMTQAQSLQTYAWQKVVLLRNKVGWGHNKNIPGSDIGRPQGSTIAQSGVSCVSTDLLLALETKLVRCLLKGRWVK